MTYYAGFDVSMKTTSIAIMKKVISALRLYVKQILNLSIKLLMNQDLFVKRLALNLAA